MKLIQLYFELLKTEDLDVLGLTCELEEDGIHCYHPFCTPFVFTIDDGEIWETSNGGCSATLVTNAPRYAFERIQNSALDLIEKHQTLRYSYQNCWFYHPNTGQTYRNLEELQLA